MTLDLTNAYRGEIRNYWALVNYGNSFVGENTISIFLDPDAIANPNVKYILISEYDEKNHKKHKAGKIQRRFVCNYSRESERSEKIRQQPDISP